MRDAIRRCFCGDAPWPLLILGSVGSGKSCAGMLMVDAAGGSCYATVADLARDVADAQFGRLQDASGFQRHERHIWSEWERANLAVLDEIGAREKVTDHHYDVVKKALDLRMDYGRPFVGISNLELADLERVYDDRIASRLASGTVVHSPSRDRRIA